MHVLPGDHIRNDTSGDSCSTLTRFPNIMIAVINFLFPLTIEVISLSQFSTITTLIVVCICEWPQGVSKP